MTAPFPSAASACEPGAVVPAPRPRDLAIPSDPAGEPFLTLPALRPHPANLTGRGEAAAAGVPVQAPIPASIRPGAPAYTYVPVRAMEDILALRARQIHEFGHTPVQDLGLPRLQLPLAARQALSDAIEDMQFNKERGQIRRRLVKAAALIMATIDRIDNEEAQHG